MVSRPNVYAWNAIISGHVKLGESKQALEVYHKMQQGFIKPDKFTFSCVLKACGSIRSMGEGMFIHEQIVRCGLQSELFIGTSLVDMYAKCGRLEEARQLFDELSDRNVVTWGAMLAGYVQHGFNIPTLELFQKMQDGGLKPSKVTILCTLKACGSAGAIAEGRLIHDDIITSSLQSDAVIGNTLVDMYAKCGKLEEALKVFDELSIKNVVSWGAMMAGYVQHGHGLLALALFKEMKQKHVKPDKVIFSCILKACGSMGAVEQGRHIHEEIIKIGLQSDMVVGSTLIDMYAKCGSIKDACTVFETLPKRDVVTWNAIISGYAQTGNHELAKQCFHDLQVEGLKPDAITYVSLLSACSHMGLVDEGCVLFKLMVQSHGMVPTVEHYNCMVDLLGRAGCLNEAEDLLQSMPLPPSIVGWTSLLSHCRTHSYAELGRRCFDRTVTIDHDDASFYVLMSDIYALAGMWGQAEQVEDLRMSVDAWKKPAKACIEVDNKVHSFVVGDRSHSQFDCIYAKLNLLSAQIKTDGNMPHGDFVLKFAFDS